MRSTPQRMEAYGECVKISNQLTRQESLSVTFSPLPVLVLILDVITRWNSTYYMLQRAHRFRMASLIYCHNHCRHPLLTHCVRRQLTYCVVEIRTGKCTRSMCYSMKNGI